MTTKLVVQPRNDENYISINIISGAVILGAGFFGFYHSVWCFLGIVLLFPLNILREIFLAHDASKFAKQVKAIENNLCCLPVRGPVLFNKSFVPVSMVDIKTDILILITSGEHEWRRFYEFHDVHDLVLFKISHPEVCL